jgi:acyl-CoA reductase-like NAD-dependent aldehyde dehydrogenase
MEKIYNLFINGKWQKPEKHLDVFFPYDGSLAGSVPDASIKEVEKIIQSASKSRESARKLSAWQRYDILSKAANLIQTKKDEITNLIVMETGKPIAEAEIEVFRAIQTIIFSAEEAKRITGEIIPMDSHPLGANYFGFTIREPKGVILAIVPFNAPFNLACHKVGPAIASGNTVILKPSSLTPLSAYFLGEIFCEAGLPDGILNVVSGNSSVIGDFLITHPEVNMVSFTGSLNVGKRIKNIAGLKTVTLELGSNSSVIIEPETDIKNIVPKFISSAFSNSGQVCISLQRAYVHEKIFEPLVEELKEGIKKMKIGNPFNKETQISSLISPEASTRVSSWIEGNVKSGAQILIGGKLTGRATITPGLLTRTDPGMKIACEEVFGPIATIDPYENFDDAIKKTNNSKYGLQVGVFTSDISKATSAIKYIEAGGVLINEFPSFRLDQMPYGGVKESGTGREGPKFAIEEMTETKLIIIKN